MRVLWLFVLSLFLLCACAKERTPEIRREPGVATQADRLPGTPVGLAVNPAEGPRSRNAACAAVASFSARTGNQPYYQFLGELHKNGAHWYGGHEIAHNPFARVVIGEQIEVGTEEEFYAKARAEYEAGRIGTVKWLLVEAARKVGGLKILQYQTIMDGIDENFPGVYGWSRPLETSLAWKLVGRAVAVNELSSERVSEILTTKLPLGFGGDWSGFAADSRTLLRAALAGLTAVGAPEENLCGFLLLHYHFNQLLTLKGYTSPVIHEDPTLYLKSWIDPLNVFHPRIDKVTVPGLFTRGGQAVALSSQKISSYNPAEGPVRVRGVGSLGEALSFTEGLLYAFQASSPAAPWVKERGSYWFGDVSKLRGPALVPGEAHALALGLLTMQFKNLAALQIRAVTAEGRLAGPNDTAAGFALGDADQHGVLHVEVRDLVRFVRVASQLRAALDGFLDAPAETWGSENPTYTPSVLRALLGSEYLGEEKRAGDPASLRETLRSLRFPTALLLVELGDGHDRACSSDLEWDLTTGRRTPRRRCTAEERAALVGAIRALAREAGSSILMERAGEIERGN